MSKVIHHQGEQQIPNTVYDDPEAREVLRAWIAHGGLHMSFQPSFWPNPSTWGILIVDLMRHLARGYEQDGLFTYKDALSRIRSGLDAEWEHPTDLGKTEPSTEKPSTH
jgi:hypothetical protein